MNNVLSTNNISIMEFLRAFFKPLWDGVNSINVPGFNLSFLQFYLGCLMIFVVCGFINKVINLNINTAINEEYKPRPERQYYVESTSYTTKQGVTHTIINRKRTK